MTGLNQRTCDKNKLAITLPTATKHLRLLFLALSLALTPKAEAQNISTIAGTGVAGFSGDTGPATAAQINHPTAICTDAAGNIYFCDGGNNRVRKISTSGVITTIAGAGGSGSYGGDGGAATAAHFNNPTGIAVDTSGNVYIADQYNHRVRKVSLSGIVTTIAGNGSGGFSGDGFAATIAQVYRPYGLCIDRHGNLYIADQYNHAVRKVNTAGIISTIAGTPGSLGLSGDGGMATAARINYPAAVSTDASDNIYISDNGNHRIRKVDASGLISTYAGTTSGYYGDGGPATAAKFYYPAGIRMDAAGQLFIDDGYNYRIRKINTSGIITTIAGDGVLGYSGDGAPATAAMINTPLDVAVDNMGNVYIADYLNDRIRKVTEYNYRPIFTHGGLQTMTTCENASAVSLDTFLTVIDTNVAQTETWGIAMPPAHGTAIVTYSMISTGGVLVPTGLSYTPTPGYSGTDGFKVSITDGLLSDETEIDVTINPLPDPGFISGIDSVCPGDSVTLSETVSGGVWSSSNTAISTVDAVGKVTGVVPGYDTVIYTVTNSCGVLSAIYPFTVRPYASCTTTAVANIFPSGDGLNIFPNPVTSGGFTVSAYTDTKTEARFILTNIVGQKVNEFTGITNTPINVKLDVPAGVYILSVLTDHQKWNKKITISNQ